MRSFYKTDREIIEFDDSGKVERVVHRPMKEMVRKLEMRMIEDAMKDADGSCAKAAEILGLNRSTLVEKRRRYGFPLNPKWGGKNCRPTKLN